MENGSCRLKSHFAMLLNNQTWRSGVQETISVTVAHHNAATRYVVCWIMNSSAIRRLGISIYLGISSFLYYTLVGKMRLNKLKSESHYFLFAICSWAASFRCLALLFKSDLKYNYIFKQAESCLCRHVHMMKQHHLDYCYMHKSFSLYQ